MESVSVSVLLASITAYGATITKVVDAVRKIDSKDKWPKFIWNLLPLLIGVVVAYAFDINLFSSGDDIGKILTGLAIGAAGSGWHEVFDAFSGIAKNGHATAKSLEPPAAAQ